MSLFIHLVLNNPSYFFLSIKLLFLMSSEICKSNREYQILHQIYCVIRKLNLIKLPGITV